MKKNDKIVKAYGDTWNDGRIQLSFALPVPPGALAKEAAKQLIKKMGFDDIEITYTGDLKGGFTHIIAYATSYSDINLDEINVKTVDTLVMTMEETDELIRKNLNRSIIVVGACIESDAHTVGIDAIMNMKGYNMRYGLERYKYFTAINMGAQVTSEELLSEAVEKQADVILVSQVVTQKNLHIKNLTRLIELAEAEKLRDKMLFICGGPRINHELAIELGYDAGFGSGTFADEVASFIALQLTDKK